MYFPATKVKVLASTTNKSGAALRKGSLGYISTVGGIYTPIAPNGLMLPHYAMAPGQLMVTRFGNEVKRRAELKPVVCVIPITSHQANGSKFKNIDALLEDAKQFTLQFAELWKESGIPNKQLPFIVAVPTTEEINVTASSDELLSWVYSLFLSPLLKSALDNEAINCGYGAVLAEKLAKYLPNANDVSWYKFFMYKNEVATLLKSLNKDKINDFVVFLQGQRSAYIRDYLTKMYNINGTANEIFAAIQTKDGINSSMPNVLNTYNLKDYHRSYKKIELSWLHACNKLNSHKGGLAHIPDIYTHICAWLKKITTIK